MQNKFLNASSNSGTNAVADGMLNKSASSVHAALDRTVNVVDDAARNAKPAIERVAGYAHQAVDKAAGAAAPAAHWINAQGQDLKATQKKLMAATCDYVKAHPLKSLGMAVAAGFLFSRIVL